MRDSARKTSTLFPKKYGDLCAQKHGDLCIMISVPSMSQMVENPSSNAMRVR
jgi:hypothetical protein